MREVLCILYLKDRDGICPVLIRILPGFAIHQAFSKNVEIEDGVVFGVLDFTLEQLHDVQERLKRAADVHNYRQNTNMKLQGESHSHI